MDHPVMENRPANHEKYDITGKHRGLEALWAISFKTHHDSVEKIDTKIQGKRQIL